MARNLAIVGGIVAILVIGVLGTMYYIAGTPQYSLYLVGKAARSGDRETFYRHFDVDRVISSSVERAVGGVPAGPRIVSKKATDTLIPAASRLLRERIDEKLDSPDTAPILGMELDGVEQVNNAAIATLRNPSDGSTTKVILVPSGDRHWKIVEIDLAKANIAFDMNEVRERAEELLGPPVPGVTPPEDLMPQVPPQSGS